MFGAPTEKELTVMRCPYCKEEDSRVIDSRSAEEGRAIRRRRECVVCGKRFTTYEAVESVPLIVIKNDGAREPFNRDKILNGLVHACNKRDVPIEKLADLTRSIEYDVRSTMEREIKSRDIGEIVMNKLKDFDEVAYIRFASVYRKFADVEGYITELAALRDAKRAIGNNSTAAEFGAQKLRRINVETGNKKRALFSFEIFPPKREMPLDTIYGTLDELTDLKPDFISVTCGAGGSASGGGSRTAELARYIKNKYHRDSIAHLPCINLSRAEAADLLRELEQNGIDKILALRGDRTEGVTPKEDFRYAAELISFVKEVSGDKFRIFAACYPEGHIEAPDLDTDIRHLKEKVDAGASHLLSQLFFDNEYFYNFMDKAQKIGINVPVEAGIMPITNKKQIERMVMLCGATLPRKFQRVLAKYEHDAEALRDAGIAFAIDQIVDLLANGVDGIHLYTMNNPYIARKISEAAVKLL